MISRHDDTTVREELAPGASVWKNIYSSPVLRSQLLHDGRLVALFMAGPRPMSTLNTTLQHVEATERCIKTETRTDV